MSINKVIGGVALNIEAHPQKLVASSSSAGSDKGEIKLVCQNYSRIPASAEFWNITSSDAKVASVSAITVQPLHIPARLSKYTARHPSTVTQVISSWTPHSKGIATLVSWVKISTSITILGSVQPDTEVEVI